MHIISNIKAHKDFLHENRHFYMFFFLLNPCKMVEGSNTYIDGRAFLHYFLLVPQYQGIFLTFFSASIPKYPCHQMQLVQLEMLSFLGELETLSTQEQG